jgi:hypothetical protein
VSEEIIAQVPVAVVVDPVTVVPTPEGVVTTPETPSVSETEAKVADATKTDIPPVKPDDEKKTSSRFERKISRLYREAAEQKARAELLQRQLNEAKPRDELDENAPKASQFDDVEKYAAARAKYASEKVVRDLESKQRVGAQQAQQQALVAGWEEKVAKAESKYDDFDEVVGDLKPTTPWAVAIMKAENGEDIAHHLGMNLKEAQHIMALDPVDQFIAIGRLSAKLQMEPVKPKQVTKAPDPINPVAGTRVTTSTSSLEAKSYQDFLRARNKELGRKVG